MARKNKTAAQLDAEIAEALTAPSLVSNERWVTTAEALALEASGQARRTGLRDRQGRHLVRSTAKSSGRQKADELLKLHGARALEMAEREWETAELTDEEARALDSAMVILSGAAVRAL